MIARNFSLTFLAKCLVFLGGLIQGVFVTRLLGPEGKGILSYMQANVAFFSLLLGLTLPLGMNYFAANKKIALRPLLGIAFLFCFGALAVLSLYVGLGSSFPSIDIILPGAHRENFLLLYFFVAFPLIFLNNVYYSTFAGLERFFVLNAIEFAMTCARICIFGALYFSKSSLAQLHFILSIDLVLLAAQFLISFFLAYKLAGALPSFRIRYAEHVSPLLKYILPIFGISLITFLYSRVDVWIIERVRGISDLGVYSIALGAAQLITFFPMAVNTVFYTYVTQAEEQRRQELFHGFSKVNLALVSLASLFLFLISKPLVIKLYGPSFAGAVLPLRILLWGYMFSSIKYMYILYNQISIKLQDNFNSELLVLALSLICNFLLIPRWGLVGASLTNVIANFLALSFLLYRMQGRSDFHWKDSLVIRRADLSELAKSFYRRYERPEAID